MNVKYILIKAIRRYDIYLSKIIGFYYANFFKDCGSSLYIRGRIYLSNPQNISIGKSVTIGPNCRIETVVDYSDKRRPILTIGDNCSIEHYVHLYCANELRVGNDCMIASGCMVTDNNHGINPIIGRYSSQQLTTKPTVLESNVWLGERVCILAGVTIGQNSIIGANSVVTKSIPANCIAVGLPAKVIKKFNFSKNEWERSDE